ncbi:MAG: glycosyltransferase family 4 protein [Candidatus Latescibacteria bacterium]|jgi:L-malate glycosyltransferase|nr:glycosyltransferase family 4 protein [Candidatus Latescibacterota bacterium]
MKICFTGPENLHLERWVTYFARKGHEVHLVIDTPVQYEGVIVHNLNLEYRKSPVYFLTKLYRLRKIINGIKPDVLHTHYITGQAYVSVLTGFRPFIVTIWGNDIYLRPHERIEEKFFTKLVLKRADMITADSEDQIDAAIALGASPESCRVVQWGVDLNRFIPGSGVKVREQLGLGDAPVLISQRKFLPLYNIDLIIRAFADTLKELPSAHLILTGGGFDEPQVRDLVNELGINDRTHFTGYIDYEALTDYLNAADVAVSVPSSDGTAMAVLEAMACGVPLVVSDLPSNREWIQDGENGYIVPVGNQPELASRLIRLLGDRPLRQQFATRNVQVIHERADHEKHMARMETYYRELCDRP